MSLPRDFKGLQESLHDPADDLSPKKHPRGNDSVPLPSEPSKKKARRELTLDLDEEKDAKFTCQPGAAIIEFSRADVFRDMKTGPEIWQHIIETSHSMPGFIKLNGENHHSEKAIETVLDILNKGHGLVPTLRVKISRSAESVDDVLVPIADNQEGLKYIVDLVTKLVEDDNRVPFKEVFMYVYYINWRALIEYMLAVLVFHHEGTMLSFPQAPAQEKSLIADLIDIKLITDQQVTVGKCLVALISNIIDNRFITTWKTEKKDDTIVLPYQVGGLRNISGMVDWGDDTVTEIKSALDLEHKYINAGEHVITVSGLQDVPFGFGIYAGRDENPANKASRLLDIQRWGGVCLYPGGQQFLGCSRLGVLSAHDKPDLRGVTSLSEMFMGATRFNGDLSSWNVSNVTDMSRMFSRAYTFNGKLSGWDVRNVTNMSYMFHQARTFNGDLSSWEVGNVTNMSYMFYDAIRFNGDLSSWEVGNVVNMDHMFEGAIQFTSDLSSWDVSQVWSMNEMFAGARNFSSDLSAWDVDNIMFNPKFSAHSSIRALPRFRQQRSSDFW